MADVTELIKRVEHETRHAPGVAAHRDNIKQLLSESYRSILEAYQWPFLVRRKPLWMFPDLTIANASLSRSSDRQFTLATGALQAAGLYAADDEAISGEFKRALPGALFDLSDRTLRDLGTGNWEMGPFEIENAEDESVGGVDTSIYLDPRAAITGLAGNEGTYSITFPRYQLPIDCANVLRLENSDGQALTSLRPDQAARLDDRTGQRPTHWMVDEGHELRFPEWAMPLGKLTPTAPVGRGNAMFGLRGEAPFKTIPFTAASTAGSMPADTYEVFVSWWYAGRLTPPSSKVRITLASTLGISLTGLPAMPASSYGRRLTVWVGKRNGPYYLATMMTAATTTTATISNFPVNTTSPWLEVRWDDVYNGNGYRYIKPWPRPATVERFELQYLARFRPLVEETDAPEFEESFHDVLVWQVAARVAAQNGADKLLKSALYFAKQRYAALKRRYGMDESKRLVRASIDGSGTMLDIPTYDALDWQG